MTLETIWLPIVVTVLAWWLSTGFLLILVRLPKLSYTPSLIALGGVALGGIWGVWTSAQSATLANVYSGFFCALAIWGWHEASFLMGKITGPRPLPCPAGATGLARFGYATAALIYHEIALFVTLLGLGLLTMGAPNQIAFWTFAALFFLRLSAKFNIFLGVPNMTDEFFPDHLEHLKSYLRKRPGNALMPVSLLTSTGVCFWLIVQMGQLEAGSPIATTFAILTTLIVLGALEHGFMMIPFSDAAIWRWAMPARPQPSGKD
jgi:putative photosynthetic complex assembly protein 2